LSANVLVQAEIARLTEEYTKTARVDTCGTRLSANISVAGADAGAARLLGNVRVAAVDLWARTSESLSSSM
jgi:hypothetical protein